MRTLRNLLVIFACCAFVSNITACGEKEPDAAEKKKEEEKKKKEEEAKKKKDAETP